MKILFIRMNDKIGDTVIESFFYRELKQLFAQARLTVMSCGAEALLRTNPFVDDFILLPSCGVRKFADAFAKIPFLRKQKYDLLISFTPHWRMKIFNALLAIPHKECFDLIPGAHVTAAYERVLQRLGKPHINTSYEVFLPQSAQAAAQSFLKENQLQHRPFLLLNPAGGDPRRTLTPARTAEIAAQAALLAPVVIVNYKHAYDACSSAAFLFESTDILQTAALLKQAAYVVTVDTGIAHIAEAFCKPMTVLFSLKHYSYLPMKDLSLLEMWGPRGKHVQKLWAEQSVNQIAHEDILASVSRHKSLFE